MPTIVFDADETLWRGIILFHDPVEVIKGIPETLKELKKRGHRLICCSKNDLGNLVGVLEQKDLKQYFEEIHAGWDPKSLAFDRFSDGGATVFVDDDAFNHAEVARKYPDVIHIQNSPGTWDPLVLLDMGVLAKDTTPEDRRRVSLLREQLVRGSAEKAYSGDYQQFLLESDLRLTIYPHRSSLPDLERALDLLNRTNELRTAKKTYSELPVSDKNGVIKIFGASLIDRYGDYGQIATGVAELHFPRGDTIMLHDLAVSCRTSGRGVGSALVVWLLQEAQRTGFSRVIGILTPTDKNGPMRPLYQFLGFFLQPFKPAGNEIWEFDLSATLPPTPPWLQVRVL